MYERYESWGWLSFESLRKFGTTPESRFQDMMYRVDWNGDGIITPEEAGDMRSEDYDTISEYGIEVVLDGCHQALDYYQCMDLNDALLDLKNSVKYGEY